MFIEPIFDRALQDIALKTKKAFLNYDDLNRIENNIDVIANELNVNFERKVYTNTSFPTRERFDYLLNIIESFFSWKIADVEVPEQPINHFKKINDIEKILYLYNKAINETNDQLIRCNDNVFTGGDLI